MANIENKYLLKIKIFLRNYFPWLFEFTMKISSETIFFKKERNYLSGSYEKSKINNIKSAVLISQPRGGTQISQEIIGKLFEKGSGIVLNIGKYYFWRDHRLVKNIRSEKWAQNNLQNVGFFFGNMGSFEKIELLPDLKYIVMCRDPRDVLISHYYSVRDAHVTNSKEMRKKVDSAKNMTIDEYVMQEDLIEDVRSYLSQAIKFIDSSKDFLFIKYEDMMASPKQFVKQVSSFLNIEITEKYCAEILLSSSMGVKQYDESEIATRHRRSGKWGQFKTKLKKGTQELLLDKFHYELKELGYISFK